jgi:hypothetical protein
MDMAKDKTDTLEADRPAVAAEVAAAVAPKLVFTLGRGKGGKSMFTLWDADRAYANGRRLVILDADRTNATLSAFFEGVLRPRSADADDVKNAINSVVEYQIRSIAEGTPISAFVDLGGGDLILKEHARDLDLVELCLASGIEPVALHFLSDDPEDLAYLRDIEESGAFCPKKTLLILNEGASKTRRFDAVKSDDIFISAIKRGAKWAIVPRLQCMLEIAKARAQFNAVAQGKVMVGEHPTVNRQFTFRWLKAMDEAFAPFVDWLP